MANKTVIEGSDNVKASQLKELFRQIDEKTITGSILQAVLDNKNPFGVDTPTFVGKDILNLVYLITGGGDPTLTKQQLWDWKNLIMCEISSMRNIYEKRNPEDNMRIYYQECWEEIDKAKDDDALIKAIGYLVLSIQHC